MVVEVRFAEKKTESYGLFGKNIGPKKGCQRGGAGAGDRPPSLAPRINTRPHPQPHIHTGTRFLLPHGFTGTRGYPWIPVRILKIKKF